MKNLADTVSLILMLLFVVVPWMLGVVIAKGFISTSIAIFIPLYAWYPGIEFFFQRYFG
jgi:hypothetical protein